MIRQTSCVTTTILLVLALAPRPAASVEQAPGTQPAAKPLPPSLKLDVTLSRLQGEKKVSSMPFTLWMLANGANVSLRMGVDFPVGSSVVTSGNENASGNRTTTVSSTTNRVEFRNVGTSIDCFVNSAPDGRFTVDLRIQDSSIFTTGADTRAPINLSDPMAFRTFTFSNQQLLRDGQTAQWTSAPDKFTGEVLRVDTTLTVIK